MNIIILSIFFLCSSPFFLLPVSSLEAETCFGLVLGVDAWHFCPRNTLWHIWCSRRISKVLAAFPQANHSKSFAESYGGNLSFAAAISKIDSKFTLMLGATSIPSWFIASQSAFLTTWLPEVTFLAIASHLGEIVDAMMFVHSLMEALFIE